MGYLLPGMVTLGLTTMMFVLLTKAVYAELGDRAGKPGRRN